jgi:hypothetical protein
VGDDLKEISPRTIHLSERDERKAEIVPDRAHNRSETEALGVEILTWAFESEFGNAGTRSFPLGRADAIRWLVRARAMVLVTAIIGALVLNASAALGQLVPRDLRSSPHEPQVSVPKSEQAPSIAGQKMIHEPRRGFVLAGSLVLLPAYIVQVLAAAGTSLSATDSSCSCYSKEAKLFLIPIAGPWLASRAAPQQEQGSPLPYLIWGGLEAAGAAMLIVGLVGHDVPQEPFARGRNLTLLPFVTPQAEGLSFLMHW